MDFTSTFRKHTIPHIPNRLLKDWVDVLTQGNVYVKRQRGYPRARALLECLQQERYIPKSSSDIELREAARITCPVIPSSERTTNEQRETATQNPDTAAVETEPQIQEHDSIDRPSGNVLEESTTNRTERVQMDHRADDTRQPRSTGVAGLMKSYHGRKQFSGAFDEDLNSALELYDIMTRMCHLSDSEKAEAMPVMLKDDALNFYMTTTKPGDSFNTISQRFIDHYMTPEQRNRVLILWQSLRLSTEMRENPEKSELEVFRCVATRLSQLQRQLSESYRKDEFLRDQIIIAADTGQIQQSMRERVPKIAADAQNRIATFLSSEKHSAGSFIASNGVDGANFSTGHKFGGRARKNLKGFNKGRRSFSKWLAAHKGYFLCRKDHRARDHHSPAEVKEAVNKLKLKYPRAMVTMDDLAMVVGEITDMVDTTSGSDEDDGSDTSEELEHSANIAVCEEGYGTRTEMHFANVAFMHGRSFSRDLDKELMAMYTDLNEGEETKFKGLYIDTCANRSSVMSYAQYTAYCEEFQVPVCIERESIRPLHGIGGNSSPIGTANIPVPFRDLNLVIDVRFQIVKDNVPSLLCMKDMLDNGLDISILDSEIRYKHLSQPLELKNYFLIHKWKRGDIGYSLYTEAELKKLHKSFGHPSVSALVNVLKRARPNEMSSEVQKTISDIVKTCLTCSVHASRPKRFKLTVGTDDLRFNHIVAIDITYISNKPILHVVDEATHYNAALFLTKISSETVCRALLKCWSQIYLGPPDFLRVDQGSQFVSKEFTENAEADGITILPAQSNLPPQCLTLKDIMGRSGLHI